MINSLAFIQVTADTASVMQKYADKWDANLQAADQAGFMIQLLASNDLIYVVLAVTLIIWFVLLFYIINTDRKVSQLEESLIQQTKKKKMKPKVVVGVIAIVGFTSLLMMNFSESISSYASFKEAAKRESAHVVGTWVESKDYGFSFEKKQFTFYMKDEKGNMRKVIYPKPKPNNFEQAVKIVVVGEMHGGVFYAKDMLMKCPSKYNSLEETEFKPARSS